MEDVLRHLPAVQAALETLAGRHRVPGAMLSIFDGEQTVDLVTGVTNCETGVAVTPDTLFQIGSITKVYTATIVMRLVDQGTLELDAPVRRYLPTFQLSNDETAGKITLRHLLTHSSGIVGDYFTNFGGNDSVERHVASLKEQELVFDEPGLMLSYSSSGTNVAGRVIEVVTGKPFNHVFAEQLLDPLGLRATTVVPEDMLRFRYAVGHLISDTSATVPPVVVSGTVPGGGRTSATAADVLRFARMHIDEGKAPNGSVVLSKEAVKAMRTPSFPTYARENCYIGLGWMVWDWGGEQCLYHNGSGIGQLSFLYVLPDRPFAVCLLTNSYTGEELWNELGRWVFTTFAGVEMPRVPKPSAVPLSIDLERYAGSYERQVQRLDVEAAGDHLRVTITSKGVLQRPDSTTDVEFWPVDERRFHVLVDGAEAIATFLEPDEEGRPRYLHFGARAAVRRN